VGLWDPASRPILKRFGLPVPEITDITRLPDVELVPKDIGTGAIVALACKGIQDSCLSGGRSSATFKDVGNWKLEDEPYTVATQTIEAVNNKFTITRIGDLAHTFVLKVGLEGPTDLDELFDSISMTIGCMNIVKIDLRLNNAMAKTYGLWPSKNNDAPREPGQKWIAVIPIMYRQTAAHDKCVIPIVSLYWNEIALELCNVTHKYKNAQYVIDVDYIANDGHPKKPNPSTSATAGKHADSSTTATEWDRPVSDEWPADKSDSAKDGVPTDRLDVFLKIKDAVNVFNFTQYQTIKEIVHPQDGLKTMKVNLSSLSHPTSGFIVIASPNDPDYKNRGYVPIYGF
jgi:hypothetical protein